MGDLVLWDFDLVHRAGFNNSTDFRSAIYGTFARTSHIKDTNFNNSDEEDIEDFSEQSLLMGRFANIPNYAAPSLCSVHDEGCDERPDISFANMSSSIAAATSWLSPSCAIRTSFPDPATILSSS
jgi:hypothetical protein